MTPEEFQHHAQQAMAAGWDCLRALPADQPERAVALLGTIMEIEAQLAGLRLKLCHEARYTESAVVVDAVKDSRRTDDRQATAALKLATELAERFPLINTALCEGLVSLEQARAIVAGLKKLPTRFTKADVRRCEEEILHYVHELGPKELRLFAARLVEIIDPEGAEKEEAERLAREERKAHADRFLRIRPDFHGSMILSGKLPTAEGSLLVAQIEALMPTISSYTTTGEAAAPEARRADALVRLVSIAANSAQLPAQGGDRPQVAVTMTLNSLVSGLGRAEVVNTGQSISPSTARRLACDAHLIPVVLGGDSEPLDVGRTRRLFTRPQRQLLAVRDQGCAFPGCDAPPAACESHHIRPWRDGGESDLNNAVLVCAYHHRVVEPDETFSPEQQWEVHLDPATGSPWFTPPRHVDPGRRPRQHRRYRLQQLTLELELEPGPGAGGGVRPAPETEPPPQQQAVESEVPDVGTPGWIDWYRRTHTRKPDVASIDNPWSPDYLPVYGPPPPPPRPVVNSDEPVDPADPWAAGYGHQPG